VPEHPDSATPPLASLFQQLILEHYKNPRNRGELEGANAVVFMNNPSCGDEVTLQLRIQDDRVLDARLSGMAVRSRNHRSR
jgi:nitrogen fixation NifU-like protein